MLETFNGHARITGPCGDTMEIWLFVEGDWVRRASFITTGCGPSHACGSMATELAAGRSWRTALEMTQEDILEELEPFPEDHRHCALLAANVMNNAAQDYLDRMRGNGCGGGECGGGECGAQGRLQGESDRDYQERLELAHRLRQIRRIIPVLSGKGGVGKSTVAVNLASALAMAGKQVGLLDLDLHGPSIPTMLGLAGARAPHMDGMLLPVEHRGLKVMSVAFFLENRDDAVIWRGPMKMGVIKQFLKDCEWGELDYLVIDLPPGTGDEPLSLCQLIQNPTGAVVVTTPQEVSVADVRRSVNFCRALRMPVLGVVENMSGFACPHCGVVVDIFNTGGGERMAGEMGAPFLGRIPIDPRVVVSGDAGEPCAGSFVDSPAAEAFMEVARRVMALDAAENKQEEKREENNTMRIAIPVADGKLAMHFGHCAQFALVDAEPAPGQILKMEMVDAPAHEPGLLPRWLGDRGVNLIIAGGMGSRAQGLFAERNIRVVTGAPADAPEALVRAYLDGSLQTGDNACDH